jgi:hypothetical protein
MFRFATDAAPLMVLIGPETGWDEATVREMAKAFDTFWKKRERYSLITWAPKSAPSPPAAGRKLLAEWANSPRVRRLSGDYCVGSATVVRNAIARGALTALMWVWTPTSPHQACATPGDAIDYCLGKIAQAKLECSRTPEEMRRIALDLMKET